MKVASPALASLINTGRFDAWECFTFSLVGGGTLLLTTAPFAIKSGTTIWPANGPIIVDGDGGSGSRAHWKVGLDVDEWSLTLAPRAIDPVSGAAFPDKIGDQPFLAGARAGLLDAADVVIQRAFFDPATLTGLLPVTGLAPTGFLTIFRGSVADVMLTTSEAVITINDLRFLLSTQMPRNIYQAGCRHTLYSARGCKLTAATFAKTGVVTSAASRSAFSTNAPAPAGSGTYALGRLAMQGGKNAGLTRMIVDWDGASAIRVSPPLPFLVAAGDAVTLYPGCDKTMTTCTAFANLPNYGGDPFIPPPTASGL